MHGCDWKFASNLQYLRIGFSAPHEMIKQRTAIKPNWMFCETTIFDESATLFLKFNFCWFSCEVEMEYGINLNLNWNYLMKNWCIETDFEPLMHLFKVLNIKAVI